MKNNLITICVVIMFLLISLTLVTTAKLEATTRTAFSSSETLELNKNILYENDDQNKIIKSSGGTLGWCLQDLKEECTTSISLNLHASSTKQISTTNKFSWMTEFVDYNCINADSFDDDTTIRLDSSGYPHIVYISRGFPPNIRYAQRTEEKWEIQTVDIGCAASFVLDTNNQPHLCYIYFSNDVTGSELRYTYWNGNGWKTRIVDSGEENIFSEPSMAIDSQGRPHISYLDERKYVGGLKYVYWDGSQWIKEDIDDEGVISSRRSLSLDSDNQPHICYISRVKDEAKYWDSVIYTYQDGTQWIKEEIEKHDDVIYLRMVFDSQSRPHVVFNVHEGFYHYRIKYGKKVNGNWATVTVNTGHFWDPNLALDSNDHPHIVYYLAEGGALIYSLKQGSEWIHEIVDDIDNGDIRIGRCPSVIMDSLDHPHISYYYHNCYEECRLKHATISDNDNNPPNTPFIPDGPTTGECGIEYTYTTSTIDPDGDKISYWFDWGDGTFSGWVGPYNSGEIVEASHQWSYPWNYSVKVIAKDAYGYESQWSDTLLVTIGNTPPNPPIISGSASGKAGIEYNYTFVSTDPNDDEIYYYIDWGNGNIEEWKGPYNSGEEIVLKNTFEDMETYTIKAKAKDTSGLESDWTIFEISMSKSKPHTNTPLMNFLNNHPHIFPLLQQLLRNLNLPAFQQ